VQELSTTFSAAVSNGFSLLSTQVAAVLYAGRLVEMCFVHCCSAALLLRSPAPDVLDGYTKVAPKLVLSSTESDSAGATWDSIEKACRKYPTRRLTILTYYERAIETIGWTCDLMRILTSYLKHLCK